MDAFDNRRVRTLYKQLRECFLTKLEDLCYVAFPCSPFTGKMCERSGQEPARRHGGLSMVPLIGELTKKSCFLFGVVFAIPLYKSKASKRGIGETVTFKQCGTDYRSLQRNLFR